MHDLENPPQNNLTFWSILMIIMWLEGSWGSCILGYNEVGVNFGWTSDWASEFQILQFSRLIFSCNCGMWKLQPNRNETKWRTEVASGRIRKDWRKMQRKTKKACNFLEVWKGNVQCSFRSIEKSLSLGNQSEHIWTLSRSLLWLLGLQDRTYCRPPQNMI